jgi:hypothetical protein
MRTSRVWVALAIIVCFVIIAFSANILFWLIAKAYGW